MKSGNIVGLDGKIVGKHQGLALYTLGQRKGIQVGGIGPLYVYLKDYKNNQLVVVGKNELKKLETKSLVAKNVNWISGNEPKIPFRCNAQIRYQQKVCNAIVMEENVGSGFNQTSGKVSVKVIFAKPQRAITPGQSVVFYQGQGLKGGGIIK